MYGAQVTQWGETPKYLKMDDPLPAESEEVQINVSVVCLHHLVRARATGVHYSVEGLPHTPGVDGVGTTPDGREVYFITYYSGKGSFVERVNIAQQDIFPLPPRLHKFQAAAFMNPAMSSWMALRRRTRALPSRFTVLILGATSASGEIAACLSRYLGAGKVIGCARNLARLATLDLDDSIGIESPATETDFSLLGHVDVVLDYVYGPVTNHLFQSLKSSNLCQYIQIGSMADPQLRLNGSVLRSKNITLMGSGLGSFSESELRAELPDLLQAMALLDSRPISVVKLSDVEAQWNQKGTERILFGV